jgi:carbonic anhydrase
VRDIVWRISDDMTRREPLPPDATTARHRLERGNQAFAELFDGDGLATRIMHLTPADLGVGEDGMPPPQRPFATLISCADARVPVELLLNERANELFVVRVAGGVLSEGAMGSLDFAVDNLESVVITVALGHTACGAVGAAVDTYLDPASYLAKAHSRPLLALVQNLFGAVRLADHTLHEVHGSTIASSPGYRGALMELSVLAQAGTNAAALSTRIRLRSAPHSPRVPVVYGVYDLSSRSVGVAGPTSDWVPGLVDAPVDGPAFGHTLREIAFGPRITGLLESNAG